MGNTKYRVSKRQEQAHIELFIHSSYKSICSADESVL